MLRASEMVMVFDIKITLSCLPGVGAASFAGTGCDRVAVAAFAASVKLDYKMWSRYGV